MMDCVIPVDENLPKTSEHINTAGSNERLVELLSLFHNTASAKGKSKTHINSLRDEIREVLERKVNKSEHEKTTEKALDDVAKIRANMDNTLSSHLSESGSAENERVVCDGNVRVLIAEQMIDLEGQLEYTSKTKVRSKKVKELEQKIKLLEGELKTERSKSSTILKHAKESDKRYKEVQTRLENERKTTERCQGIAKTLNYKLHKIRSLLEEAANKQNPAWQSKINEMKLQLDDVTLVMEPPIERTPNSSPRKNKH